MLKQNIGIRMDLCAIPLCKIYTGNISGNRTPKVSGAIFAPSSSVIIRYRTPINHGINTPLSSAATAPIFSLRTDY